jgi:integrase
MVFLNADEIMTLADELADPPIRRGGGERRRPSYPERGLLVRFASFTGLRSGEIVALRTETIDLLHGRVHVVASATEAYGKLQFGSPKTYQRRTVPLPQALVDELTTALAGKAKRRLRVHIVERWPAAAFQLLCPALQTCRDPGWPPGGHQVP